MVDHAPSPRPASPDGLAAQLLLLAVGERARFTTAGDVRPLVAAATLADDVLTGRPLGSVVPGPDRLHAHLRGPEAEAAFQAAAAALVRAGRLRPHAHRVLGLFPREGFAVTDPGARAHVTQHVTAALVPGRHVATRDAVLAALASVSGLARPLVPLRSRDERDAMRAHVNALADRMGADQRGADLVEVVRGLRRAYRRKDADDTAVVFVPGSDRDGFGDRGGDGSADGGGDGGDGGGGGGGE
ncbi:GPP34 family phosphoprotein [Aquipuribacter sp. MA13-6]|uniref:GPP34 family phosphoprotein n=1 Tax=unclassified Aquipuribacter TaxID=2635084 RepID=UPI003EEB836F